MLFGERALGTLPDDLNKSITHGADTVEDVAVPVDSEKRAKTEEGQAV